MTRTWVASLLHVSLLELADVVESWDTMLTSAMQYTKAMRLFKEDPKWTPLQRGEETDSNPYRKDYLQTTTAATSA
jgi:cupin superfamily acireductone dioxygenase involved in methionine salvage